MDELVRQLTEILRGIWQRRWLGLAIAWIVAVVGAVALLRMPDQFEASARVYVDTQSVLRPLMSGLAIQPNVDQQLNILSRTLISRPNVEKLIRMTDMDLKLRSQRERERAIDELMRTIRISGIGRENLYTLSFRDANPEHARKIVQSLLSIFVESTLGDKRQDTAQARRFIEEQIRTYEQRLAEAENRLKEFKLKYMGLMGPEGRDYFGRITALAEQVNGARMELGAAEQARDALKRELAGEDPVFLPDGQAGAAGSQAGIIPELDARIDAMKKGLDELLRRYTEQHPDVVGTRRVIADLEAQRAKEIEARKKDAPAKSGFGSIDRNPVYQQLKIAHAEAEARVAALRAKVGAYEAEYRRLQASQQMLPQVEAEFAQLNRDYDVQKRNYEALVARRESASMASDMEAAGTADFRIIDPPRVSPKPVAPNRLLLLPLALVVALGAGIAASFAWSQIRPTFHDGRALRAIAGRPVLGSVSLVPDRKLLARRQRLNFAFFGSLAGLFACYGAGIAFLVLTGRIVV
ncbi:MAG: chain length-determining protein [Burkholderiales bacterium]|nr:chain length-determining protein [Burkholderiales bacterium]